MSCTTAWTRCCYSTRPARDSRPSIRLSLSNSHDAWDLVQQQQQPTRSKTTVLLGDVEQWTDRPDWSKKGSFQHCKRPTKWLRYATAVRTKCRVCVCYHGPRSIHGPNADGAVRYLTVMTETLSNKVPWSTSLLQALQL